MKLNPDCVRDILLFVEENGSYETNITPEDIQKHNANYSVDEITYAIDKLNEACYLNVIETKVWGHSSLFQIKSITYSGHEFLDNIRDANVWEQTKKAASKFASVSLNILSSVASNILISMLVQ